ncbi:MAG: hypothetical protein IKT12_07670, partial [Thermoguttaceae bacterium]|nr:hypothetical protein [Thermoguttaceae bacterium]
GFAADLLTDLDEVEQRAKDLFRAGTLRALVGVGGDGTAAELVRRTDPGTPVTLLPAGTANLIAREFHLPFSPAKSAQMIETGTPLSLDAAEANGKLFLIMFTAGIDAEIVAQVHRKREEAFRGTKGRCGHIGYRSYLRPVFQSVCRYPYPAIRVETAGSSDTVRWAFLFNIPRYGFGAAPAVGCDPRDGLLDFCGFRRGGLFPSLFGVALACLGKAHRFFPGYTFEKCAKFRLAPLNADAQIPFQIDGDPAGFLPVDVEIVPKRLTLLVGEKAAARYL